MAGNLRPVDDKPPSRRGRPRKLANARDEREMLTILRRQLAARLDAGKLPAHSLSHVVKQFRDIDQEIRVIDARAAQQAADDAYDSDDGEASWNPAAI